MSILVLEYRSGIHHKRSHGVQKSAMKEGIHYELVGIRDVCVVEMVQKEGHATFRVLEE